MPKGKSPLARKRGPSPLNNATLIKKLETLRKHKAKRRFKLPSRKLWPGQVKAGVEALKKCLWSDPSHSSRNLVYPADHEKIVRAIFVACVGARVERSKKMKARKENPQWSAERRAAQGEATKAMWARRRGQQEQVNG